MEQKKILVTGGSGLLGSEIQKLLPNAYFPAHSEFDVTTYGQMADYVNEKDIKLVVHAAAFTSPPRIDKDPEKAVVVNIIGTANVVKLCSARGIKLFYICTDYIFKGDKGNYSEKDPVLPVNKYAWSKLGGECAVRLYDNSLIIRTSFGENEFPYDKGFTDQWTSRLTVRDFAGKLVDLLDRDITGVLHVGGPRRTVLEYGRAVSPEKHIGELSIYDVSFNAPKDTSLDISKYKSIENNEH